jgi:hypothetical protein
VLDPSPISVVSGLPQVSNPTGIAALGRIPNVVGGAVWMVGIALIAVVIGHLAWRSRHAPPQERQQVKLLAYAALLTIAVLVMITIAQLVGVPLGDNVWDVPIALGFGVAVPLACTLAILKHGLYEIDRLISRTITYTILTTLLVGMFFGIVLITTTVVPSSSPVAVTVSTLAAAALFNPLRRSIQRAVDRRFNRARYDLERTVADFGAHLRNAVDLDTIRVILVTTAADSVQPSHVTVWLNATAAGVPRAALVNQRRAARSRGGSVEPEG